LHPRINPIANEAKQQEQISMPKNLKNKKLAKIARGKQ
jgi:hypothetical protein